jgi:hypothetical protein
MKGARGTTAQAIHDWHARPDYRWYVAVSRIAVRRMRRVLRVLNCVHAGGCGVGVVDATLREENNV